MPKFKVDLTIIKRLVSELELSMKNAESLVGVSADDKVDVIVELNKATGLTAGILAEAGLLMGDIQREVSGTGAVNDPLKQDFLKSLLGGLKGPGNAN